MKNVSALVPTIGWLLALTPMTTSPIAARQASLPRETSQIRFEQHESRLAVLIGDDLFTDFVFKGYDKPIFYPIHGPGQIGMTRNWPMSPDVPGEAHDHPHHKSMWFAHPINGVDFWSETGGSIQIKKFELQPTQNRFQTSSIWVRRDTGATVCSDITVYRFGFDESARWIDATITVSATHGDITFDDTKEGSFAVRTHPDLQLTAAVQEGVTEVFGTAINSNAETGLAIWGKQASWVLYSGPIDEIPMAIAILDHPKNLRHPTTWHARDYGLIAANPFGLHDMQNKPIGSGSWLVKHGDALTLRYRILFLKGHPTAADLEKRHADFVADEG